MSPIGLRNGTLSQWWQYLGRVKEQLGGVALVEESQPGGGFNLKVHSLAPVSLFLLAVHA